MSVMGRLTQEQIVFALAVLLCAVFALALPGFLSADNLLNLVRSVSILGMLGVAMGLVVIGRGIDLSLVALMAVSVAWALQLAATGMDFVQAAAIGLGFSLIGGMITGVLIAFVEIPAIFATLAMGTLIYGFGRYFLFDLDVVYLPDEARYLVWLGQGSLAGVPVPIFLFAAVCLVGYLFLRYTRTGRYLRAVGDNLAAARIAGVPARPTIVLQYMLSASIGYVAGIVTAASVASMNTRVANSTYVYDVILVVVLGGIGLSGGRGGIRNVVVGTLLIGILLNGMTIMNIQYTVQNVIKGMILLSAIVIDTFLNPRDEQTAQQGDI
ncbi:ABC transporter permease [Marivibrio halodurans]|uniref:ABC transporter permease n=1 Tax=Marivibrio halodurans TaxID=2039722 RepID=A0A8J7V1W0_9PROT|nr:ABC transporter permease [Marivibrio halodurans]MBP5856227.1 ABC transporter permease [Marivibrio halodurans]